MKHTMTISEMAEALRNDENANWSYQGARAMAEYLDEYMPEDAEFDRVAVRCDWSEYKSAVEWADDYFGSNQHWGVTIGIGEDDDTNEVEEKIKEYIMDNGMLLDFGDGIIVSSF